MIASASSLAEHGVRRVGRKQVDDAIEQIAGAFAVDRRNGDRLAESQTRKFAVHRGKRARRLGFICDQYDSASRCAQNLRDVFVERMQSALRIDDEHDYVGFGAAASAWRRVASAKTSPCAASASGSMPAVSTMLKVRPRHSHSA